MKIFLCWLILKITVTLVTAVKEKGSNYILGAIWYKEHLCIESNILN
jgi:hypothetical protein